MARRVLWCGQTGSQRGMRPGIGHGGVPVYMNHRLNDPIPNPGDYEFRDYTAPNPLEHWALFWVCSFGFPR
jgi:hypothetical protein